MLSRECCCRHADEPLSLTRPTDAHEIFGVAAADVHVTVSDPWLPLPGAEAGTHGTLVERLSAWSTL